MVTRRGDSSGPRAILRVTEGGLKAAVHRSIWEQAFLSIDRKSRDVAKVIVDGMFARVAEGGGAVCGWVAITRRLARLGCSGIQPGDELAPRLPDSCPCVSALGSRLPR